jgi:hypothetical protein
MLGDVCHEMATAVLPQFMRVIGASAASLGFIEGLSDALSSFVKLGAGFHSDKIGHRKAWTVIGYILTAVAKAIFAFALAWPLILVGLLWTAVGPGWGFGYSVLVGPAGALCMTLIRTTGAIHRPY